MVCGGPRTRLRIEITTLSQEDPVYVPGRWESCPVCDDYGPVAVPAPIMGPSQDVPVPSPEDLLRAFGLWYRLP